MASGLIDLRSDTVTRPTPAMLDAMVRAETGDDVYGEDPTVRALEERVADLLDHEAALFTVSGSMANLLGVHALVGPGEELLCEASAHVVRAELGGHAAWHGVTTRTWTHPRGHADAELVGALLAPAASPYLVRTAAVAVENTHNFAGGTVQPPSGLAALRALADRFDVRLHLDGARIWNAQVALGVPVRGWTAMFDTAMVSLSKGLGAPVGSLLAGSAELIAEARVRRKRLGGGWRQAGVLAAAGLHALDHHVERLADDHANARAIAAKVAEADASAVDPDRVETNIALLDLGARADEVVDAARREGVLVSAVAPGMVRLITHLDVSAEDARRAGDILARLVRA